MYRKALSAEIRREADEEFSSIGGFFKTFELILIAAEERDIVKLRTNFRGEDVSLFPLRLTPEQARLMLVSYLEWGNQLAAEPELYNTITANCPPLSFVWPGWLTPAFRSTGGFWHQGICRPICSILARSIRPSLPTAFSKRHGLRRGQFS